MNLISGVHTLFAAYTLLLFLRIGSSWFPQYQKTRFVHFLHFYTEPYLGLFRKVLPPIGGMLDLSPVVGYMVLRIVESLILSALS